MKVRVPRARAIATIVSLAGVFVALGPQACSSPTQSDTRASDTRVSTSSFPLAVALPIPPQSVLTQHNDISRTGAYPYESQLTPASVRTRGLVKQRAIQVDANVQVQTLFTPAGSVFPHDTVYTATLNDTVYAIDATTGAILWTKALVDPTYGACAATDPSDQKVVQARCYPMGITATPVIDGTTGTMYVVYGTRNSNLRGAPLCWTPPPAGVASGILTPTGQPANRYRGCGWTTEDVCPFGCDPTGAAPAAGPCEGSWHDNWFGGPSSTAHGPNPGAGRIYPNSFTDWWDGNSKSAPFNVAWYLAAIDASTGTLLRSVQIQGTGRQGVPFEGRSQQPRPGLLLASGNVYAGFGASSEFETPYHGWLFGYNASTFALAGVWNTTTTSYLGEGGGVWQAGGGVVGDPSGNVYVATGNGIVDEVQNFSNNIVKLPPNLASATAFTPTTSPEGYGQANTSSAICPFNPAAPAYGDCCIGPADANGASNAQLTTTAETYNAAYLNYANLLDYWDLDLGGGGLLFINDGGYQRVLGGGKTGISYLLDPSSMTTVQPGFRAFCDQWTFQARDNYLEYTLGNAPHLHGSPIYWHPSGASGRVYEWSEKDRLKAFTFANGTLSTVPLEAPQEETLANHTLMPGGMLSLSASGTTWGSGVVWATLPVYCSNGTDPNATPAGQNTCGMLIAHDAQTLDQIFATNLEASNGAQIGAPKWSPPTVANGHVFLGTQSPAGGPPAELQIFGLGPLHAAGTPTVGPALAVVGSQVQIWSNQWNVDVPPAPPEVPAYSPFCVSPQVCKIGDVNGDGREDLIALSNDANGIVWADLSNGWSFQAPQQVLSGFCTTGQTCAVGDMNGDGLADLVAFNPSNSSVIVALATASSTSNPSYDSCSAYSSLGVSFGTPVVWSQGAVCGAGHVCDVADVTGDGKADIVDFQNGHGTGGTSNVEIAVSSGAGLLAAQSWLSGFCDPGQTCAVADVNGDGTADAIAYDPSKNVWVALSSGTGFGGVNVWGSFLCTGSYSCSFADVTGDGRADLLQLTHSATVNMAPSAWPAPMFDAATFWDGEICASPQTCLIGDVNGDHLADAVAIDPSGVPIWAVTAVPATPVTYGQGLAWQNPTSGVISIWNLDGTTVANSMNLQWTCGTDCGWRVVDTGTKAAAPGPGNSILWYNSASGQLAEWVFDATGNVNTTPAYTWTCSTATDCAPSWQPIGRVNQVVATTGAVGRGLLWYNSSLGQLSIWELANGTTNVTTQTPLPQTCVGCAGNWEPVLTSDFDNDGNTDILWYNVQTGALGLWLLNGSGSVSQFVNLSMSCGGSCEQTWKIAGAADVNGDGNVDVLWQNLTNGQMMSWLLNGSSSTVSTVIGQVTIAGATAPAQSLPLGFINYPAPL